MGARRGDGVRRRNAASEHCSLLRSIHEGDRHSLHSSANWWMLQGSQHHWRCAARTPAAFPLPPPLLHAHLELSQAEAAALAQLGVVLDGLTVHDRPQSARCRAGKRLGRLVLASCVWRGGCQGNGEIREAAAAERFYIS